MKTFVALILCIANSISPATKHIITEVARGHKYQVSYLNNKETAYAGYAYAPNRCALVVMPSTADHIGVYFLYYDKELSMTPSRMDMMLRTWESWL